MKLNVKLVAIALVSFAMPTVVVLTVKSLQSEPLPECVSVLKEKAKVETRKMVAPNQDGGLFLLLESHIPNNINFHGFLGPKTASTLQQQMQENGLKGVEVKVEGQCETESGLVYTLVSGHYEMPVEKPDPI